MSVVFDMTATFFIQSGHSNWLPPYGSGTDRCQLSLTWLQPSFIVGTLTGYLPMEVILIDVSCFWHDCNLLHSEWELWHDCNLFHSEWKL